MDAVQVDSKVLQQLQEGAVQRGWAGGEGRGRGKGVAGEREGEERE